MTTGEGAKPPGMATGAIVLLVATLALTYIVSQFLRNSVGVIAPNLAAELNLTAGEIGLLSSTFFFAFAGAQIPLGMALDRYGPKACMLACAGIAALGALLFAWSTTATGLIASRVLMGIGSCCYLMAPLALYARRFPADRFTALAGIQLGLGTLGALLATAPLAYSTAAVGWRLTFVGVAGMMLLAGALVGVVVRDDGMARTERKETLRETLAGLGEALRTPSVAALFVMQLASYSSFVLVAGLWGGPYLTHVYGFTLAERGNMLLLSVVAQIVGMLLWGQADRLVQSYKLPVIAGALLTAATLAGAALAGKMPPAALVLFFVAIGLFSAYVSVLIAHGRALFPSRLVGRGLTVLNLGTMGGGFLSQTASGYVIDLFPAQGGIYPLAAYQTVFGLQAAFGFLACLFYMTSRDPRRGG
ncbi:MAG: MFS transporter [Pseudorhodoplanes sp.]